MKQFIKKHNEKIAGTIGCFDRVLFKGHLPISSAGGMANFLRERGVLFKDFGKFVQGPAQQLKQHAIDMARNTNRPYVYVNSKHIRKEDLAREIAKRDGITEGLVCIFATTEGCLSFRLQGASNGPRLANAKRKCLCLYFYMIDPEVGLLHVRIQTWFSFMIQICVNGHEWLARRMEQENIAFHQEDNCFTRIADFKQAQLLADDFVKLPWIKTLRRLAGEVNPLLNGLLDGMEYYWVCDQAEYATDLIFAYPDEMNLLYEKLLEHAIIRFGAKDILTFLDKVADGRFKGEQFNICRRRQTGARVRHWVKRNWIKMYNKRGVVIRVETVINYPYDFKVFRNGIRNKKQVMGWYPLSKNVTYLYRYEQIARTANSRYFDALAVQDDPHPAEKELEELVETVRKGERSYSGFNPARKKDRLLFAEIMRAEYFVSGFKNADIRKSLFGESTSEIVKRRTASMVTRFFQRLHHRRIIAKIPRSRRWRITQKGLAILGALQHYFHQDFPVLYAKAA